MKKVLLLLLALSLSANVALLIYKTGPSPTSGNKPADDSANIGNPRRSKSKLPAELLAALNSGDEAALKALGLSEDESRSLILGRLIARYIGQMREFRAAASGPDKKYWQGANRRYSGLTAEQQAKMRSFEHELDETAKKTFGDLDDGFFAGNNRYRYLPKEKRDELQRIERDYTDMAEEVQKQQEGIALPSDQAKLELLQKEKERDILAALSPEERALDEYYNSSTASTVRNRYGDLIQSEDLYKKIYALQKAFDDQYSLKSESGQRPGLDAAAERLEAQRKLSEEVCTLIGDDAISAYRRENDTDLKALNALQTRLNLPAGTIDQVYALRDTYAAQSQVIQADTSLTASQRREQLTALATQAKADAATKLGQEGAEAYATRSPWISMLSRGVAFSTNPADGASIDNFTSSVFPLAAKVAGRTK